MSRVSFNEQGSKLWSPASAGEVVLDGLSLGINRVRRAKQVRAEIVRLDESRVLRDKDQRTHTMTPELLPDLVADTKAEKIARLALAISKTANLVHISTFQGFTATSWKNGDGTRSASSGFMGTLHEPTLYRVKQATGRDYVQEIRGGHDVVALTTNTRSRGAIRRTGGIEGIGRIAHEYPGADSRTDRITDATFLIQGVTALTAERFTGTLGEYPAEMLDALAYTAFAGTDLPGRSMLQTEIPGQPSESLFVPGLDGEVTLRAAPTL